MSRRVVRRAGRLAANGLNNSVVSLPAGDFAIAGLAAAQDDLVAAWQLKPLGYDRNSIFYRVKVGRLHPVYPGVYAVGSPSLTPRGHLRAALLHYGPTALLSHRSAAALWGIRPTAQANVDVMVPGSSRHKRRGINLHRVRHLVSLDAVTCDGLPATSLARTALDIATTLRTPGLVRALEQADRLELLDLGAIDAACERYPNHPGRTPLQAAVEDLRDPPRTRSELERDFLDLVRDAGLPEPTINSMVAGFEVDFHWPQRRLVVELDGHAYHHHNAAFERDREKDAALQRAGQRVLRVTHRRLHRHAARVAEDLTALYAL